MSQRMNIFPREDIVEVGMEKQVTNQVLAFRENQKNRELGRQH